MPRIHNYLTDCVVYLYPSEDHAAQGEKIGGSGFLVNTPLEVDPARSLIWAVTNQHVADKAPCVRLNARGKPFAIADLLKDAWIPHPDGDDLAIASLPLDFNRHKFSTVPRSMLLSKGDMDKFDIGIGDDVFVVGRFINHEGKQQNTPSLRFGNIAQMPARIRQDGRNFDQESFLVEARSIGGYSGSPVFVHMLPLSSRPNREDPKTMMIVPSPGIGPWLLGIDWGHLTNKTPVLDRGVPVQKHYVKENTGMMNVVPAWKLEQLFLSYTAQRIMKKANENRRKEMEASTSASDFADSDDSRCG